MDNRIQVHLGENGGSSTRHNVDEEWSDACAPLGALKMREWKNRHGQNCRAGKCRSGNIGKVMQGVENAGVEFAGGLFERSQYPSSI